MPAPWREVSITCDVTVEGGEHHVLRVLSCLPFRAQSDGMRFGCAAVGPEELGSELVSIRLVCERLSECARGAAGMVYVVQEQAGPLEYSLPHVPRQLARTRVLGVRGVRHLDGR